MVAQFWVDADVFSRIEAVVLVVVNSILCVFAVKAIAEAIFFEYVVFIQGSTTGDRVGRFHRLDPAGDVLALRQGVVHLGWNRVVNDQAQKS